jgi:hypothetical protein
MPHNYLHDEGGDSEVNEKHGYIKFFRYCLVGGSGRAPFPVGLALASLEHDSGGLNTG